MVLRSRLSRRSFVAGSLVAGAARRAGGRARAQSPVTPRYGLWDANQLPAYQACVDQFMAANPNITIAIEQIGWDDYWTGLRAGFLSESAPDVFTNHLAKYPEFASRQLIVDIQPLVDQDQVDTTIYVGELASLWTRDGKRYGLPKDWDTVATVYNQEALQAAGLDPALFAEWTWNPDDGGSFLQTIAQLSVDENGNNGLSPDFDRTRVRQYGFAIDVGDPYGQTHWSPFAASTGWRFIDQPWATESNLDDPRLIQTVQPLADLSLQRGFMVPREQVASLNTEAVFAAGTSAITIQGSWMINWFRDNVTFPFGFARLPIGPEGRISMFNGLADSIWAGTQHQEEAWEWVKFLASPAAQEVVGGFAAVFPAIPAAAERAQSAWAEKGIDVSPFLDQALEPNGTFLFPITDHASEYTTIMQETMQAIALGEAPASEALPRANEEVNALFT